MLSIGRLWRRAPAWRLLLAVAVACTVLAAMFPPAAPRWLLTAGHRLGRSGPSGEVATLDGGVGAHFKPQAEAGSPDYVSLEQPPLGLPRSALAPFAGRQLALPAGGWQTLMLVRAPGAPAVQQQWLGRVEGGVLTGLLLATAPDAVAGGLPPAPILQPCATVDMIAFHMTPAVPGNPFVTECWTVGVARVGLPGTGMDVAVPKFERLSEAGIVTPSRMLTLRYSRSDQNGWIVVLLLLPDRSARSPAEDRRVDAWARRFATLLHRGYDRELSAGSIPPAAIRDPA